jgi:hypothetical protein
VLVLRVSRERNALPKTTSSTALPKTLSGEMRCSSDSPAFDVFRLGALARSTPLVASELFDERKPPEANRQVAVYYRPASVAAITIFDGIQRLMRVAVVGRKALQTLAIGRCLKDAADDRGTKESIPKSLV